MAKAAPKSSILLDVMFAFDKTDCGELRRITSLASLCVFPTKDESKIEKIESETEFLS